MVDKLAVTEISSDPDTPTPNVTHLSSKFIHSQSFVKSCLYWNAIDYIRDLLKKSEDAAEAHEAAGHRAKKRHSWCAFPAMLIPSVSAPIVGVCRDDDWSSYFAVSSLVLTAAFNGFSTFFNFGEKSQKHFNFAGRYSDIVTDIQECLCKVKSKRVPGQVALRTFKMQYDSLALSAPET